MSRQEVPLVEARDISKRFPGVQALDRVDFTLRRGEVHALLGGNGAGKSTLIRILGGIERPDGGSISIDGNELPPHSIASSLAAGIRIIHQELALAPNLTVGENIYLGAEPCAPLGLVRRGEIHLRARALLHDVGFPLDSHRRVGTLTVGERQLVEIARALSASPRVLILDEPTAALDDTECERLFEEISKLRHRGIGIIHITHRLEEVFRIADRVTVLRDGRSVLERQVSTLGSRELVEHLVGEGLELHQRVSHVQAGSKLLEVRNLRSQALADVSFSLARGEVLGVAGQMGSGRSELARALAGIDRTDAGELILDGHTLRLHQPADAITAGIALVPEDRRHQGLFSEGDVRFNLTLPDIKRWLRFGVTQASLRNRLAAESIRSLDIRARPVGQRIRFLSGGNQQKVVIGKWLGSSRKVLILDDPARGVDVAAKEEIFSIVDGLAARGLGIIFISSEIPEILRVSDRVLVLRRGRVQTVLARSEASEEVITQLAAGHAPDDPLASDS